MDYNYVRMRNAASRGDTELAAKYRKLYEKGGNGTDSHVLDLIIVLLVSVAVALGIYIAATGNKNAAEQEAAQTVERQENENAEQPDYVTQPEGGDEAGAGSSDASQD